MYYVYILKSSKSQTLYYGHTEDLKKRFLEHNQGKSKYTKTLMPWQLVWYLSALRWVLGEDWDMLDT